MFTIKNSSLLLILTYALHLLLLTPTSSSADDQILYDIYPFIRVYRNGTIQRFIGQGFLPANTDPTTGVRSKDIIISKDFNISARIYLPKKADPAHKIPLLVYYHGGGFFTESAFSPNYHHHLNSLVARANVVAVSVNYRLAPEHPLPIAFQDSWAALKWVFHHSGGSGDEPWLTKYADFGRVYLGGDSAGGTLAHHMAMRVGLEKKPDPGVKVNGMLLNCPHFWGKKLLGNESADVNARKLLEALWLHAYPNSTGLDDPLVNPAMDPGLKMLGCKRVLVYVAGNDVLRFRGWYYRKVLKKSGWNGIVKVVEVKGENHVFSVIDPTSPKSIAMLKAVAFFLNR